MDDCRRHYCPRTTKPECSDHRRCRHECDLSTKRTPYYAKQRAENSLWRALNHAKVGRDYPTGPSRQEGNGVRPVVSELKLFHAHVHGNLVAKRPCSPEVTGRQDSLGR
nr:putative integron gene cassette protein [uncultured bacterium]